ncbi:hypothetical protein JW964_21625, partial [candidate division KSB1 bacterium]|nr:hypothetical protein [candidate division KSB1 bacterium]
MDIKLKRFFIIGSFILISITSACATTQPADPKPKPLSQKCGDGICEGPEGKINCPEDCEMQESSQSEAAINLGEPGPIYLGIMVHLEGWQEELVNEEMFDHHVRLIREYSSLFETYGAKLTWESKEITEASILWGDKVLKEMEQRGHGIGVHADVGGQKDYDCSKFEHDLKVRKDLLESLGVTVRHASGVVSHCDWVAAMIGAGFEFTSGNVAYAVMSMPEASRPDEFRNCESPFACHDLYPAELSDRMHP